MATWEDGPEYAPHERPQYFAGAPVPPLETAAPFVQPAADAPIARPRFEDPVAPVAPLAELVPIPPDERDPSLPFDVATAAITSETSWGGVGRAVDALPGASTPTTHDRFPSAPTTHDPFPSASTSHSAPSPVAPAAPWPGAQQPPAQAAPQPDPYGYPAPGTPSWFSPPPATYGEHGPSGRVGAKEVVDAATPGLCICLAVGGLIYVLAPVMLVVAVFLSTRVKVAQRTVRIAFRTAAGAVGLFAVIGLARSALEGTGWWGFVGLWSLLICWVMLVVLLVTVWRALTRPTPPNPTPWG